MIQVQNTRFHFNWMKKDLEYPSYDRLLPEFKREWKKFRAFAKEEDLGEVTPNQWEITYVNHIPAGLLWRPGEQWTSLFPWLKPPAKNLVSFDSVTGTWRFIIGKNRGRLHVKILRAKHPERGDILVLDLTARGPLEKNQEELEIGLGSGHDAIVFSFAEMTSKKAHHQWGRYR